MKTEKEIEKLSEEWMKGKELYATYDSHITGFIKGYTQCQQDNVKELEKLSAVIYDKDTDIALLKQEIKSLNKQDK